MTAEDPMPTTALHPRAAHAALAFAVAVAFAAVVVVTRPPLAAAAPAPLARGNPDALGVSTARLARIRQVLEADVKSGLLPGAVVAVARRGKIVYFEALGYLDKTAGIPMPRDAIFSIASMTKPLVGVGTMLLQEEGRLHLAEPAAMYLPSLGNMRVAEDHQKPTSTVPARYPMSIQDLMRHTAGMVHGFSGNSPLHKLWPMSSAIASRTYDAQEFLAKISSLPLAHHPATVWEYSMSIDVLGILVEAITKQTLGQFLDARLFQPLGMTDTGFMVPADKVKRYARALPLDPDTSRPQAVEDSTKPTKFQCGGSCAVSTAGDYLRFGQMLLDGGRLGATRILGRKSVELMTADHLGKDIDFPPAREDPTRRGSGHGLTMAMRTHPGISPFLGSEGEFGWGGAYGTQFWVDPREQLVVVFMAHTPSGKQRVHYRQLIGSLVLQALVDDR
jgi:CubicO group peptidase (beta-lactamase class C family)